MKALDLVTALACCFGGHQAVAQQHMGDAIPNSLPSTPGAEITYFRIPDPAGKNNNLTLINYYSTGKDGQRLVESKIQRAVVIVHGLARDPNVYASNIIEALKDVTDPNINPDTVAILAPFFANGDDKNRGYPWESGRPAGQGSTSNALVWPGSKWSAGGDSQYPTKAKNISSYYVLDSIVRYFDDTSIFPNMKQIVVGGHSLGGQAIQRYAALGERLNTKSPVTLWVANPNSYVWMSTDRPFDHSNCPIYDDYRDGYTNFVEYPMTYGTSLTSQGRNAIIENYNSKQIAYSRGMQDTGDGSSDCAPSSQGATRMERHFTFIKAFPPSCPDPNGRNCDTIDYIEGVGHDGGQMAASTGGLARLFYDNFYGDNNRTFDVGYPRQQVGDDPYPNPSLVNTPLPGNTNTYAGGMTYYGCWSDQAPRTLLYNVYDNSSNTIELCTSTCHDLGYSVAGVEYYSGCFCGNSLTSKAIQLVESSCTTPCAGNSNEMCGGNSRISIFSNGRPTQSPPPSNPETVGTWKFSGCYTEGSSVRALNSNFTSDSSMTLATCSRFCEGHKYFGAEYGSECWCGDSFSDGAVVTTQDACSMLCSGDNVELCGGVSRLSVYAQSESPASSISTSVASQPTAEATPTKTEVSPGPASCPGSNNTIVAGANNANFFIECGVDRPGGDLALVGAGNLQECIDACSHTSGCVDVSLYYSFCFLKSSLTAPNPSSNILGARLIPPGTTLVGSPTSTPSSSSFASSSSSLFLTSVRSTTSSSLTFGSTSSFATFASITTTATNFTTFNVSFSSSIASSTLASSSSISRVRSSMESDSPSSKFASFSSSRPSSGSLEIPAPSGAINTAAASRSSHPTSTGPATSSSLASRSSSRSNSSSTYSITSTSVGPASLGSTPSSRSTSNHPLSTTSGRVRSGSQITKTTLPSLAFPSSTVQTHSAKSSSCAKV